MAKNGLSRTQVEHIAKLASLPLTVKETSIFQEQLSEVVEYVGKIGEAKRPPRRRRQVEAGKTQNETSYKEAFVSGVGREDTARSDECLVQEDALSGTESKHNGLFVVPAVFEE